MEDELGYVIDAEKLELFSKPKHFVNFITQMEAYKAEHSKLPHENTKAEFNRKELFPGLPFSAPAASESMLRATRILVRAEVTNSMAFINRSAATAKWSPESSVYIHLHSQQSFP